MKIMLFRSDVVGIAGGAEKVLCNMANEMTRRGHDVTIVCDDIKQGRPFYTLDSNVAFHNLNGTGKERKAPLAIKLFRKIINPIQKLFGFRPVYDIVRVWEDTQTTRLRTTIVAERQPDVVIAYCLFEAKKLMYNEAEFACPIILMLHETPELYFLELAKQPSTKSTLARCAVMQVLMTSYKQTIDTTQAVRTVVIPNAVPAVPDAETATHEHGKSRHIIVMVGRLDKDKQQHFLIEAFAKIANVYPQWHVELYGGKWTSGYQKVLEDTIQKYHLDN